MTYSDPDNDTDIMHPFPQLYDLHADDLYDYKSEINYNIPSLTGESDFVSEDFDQLDIQNQQRNENSNDGLEILTSIDSSEYNVEESSEYNVEHEHDCKMIGMTSPVDTRVEQVQESRTTDFDFFDHVLLRNNASVVWTPMSTNDKTSIIDATSYAKKGSDMNGEVNSKPNVHQSASSLGSNPTPQSIESGRCFDLSDNMEVLQVAGMSCSTREPLNLGDLFDAENNVQNIEFESFKSHNDKNDQWDKIKEYEAQDIKCKEVTYGITSCARNSYSANKFDEEIEHSLYSPDCHFCNTNSSDRDEPHCNEISSTILEKSLADEGMESQVDSRCLDNASCTQPGDLLSCHSYYLPEFCKWDQKGKCATTSNRVKDSQSSSYFLEDASQKENTPCKQKDSEVLMSKFMLSCVPKEEGIVNAAAIKLGSDGKLNNGCLDPESDALGVDKCERCLTQDDDTNDSCDEGVTTQDIGDGGQRILDMITNDAVALTNCDEGVPHIGCGKTNQSSKLECNDAHQACQYYEDHIYHPEHADMVCINVSVDF